LGLPVEPGGVEDEERVLGPHLGVKAVGGLLLHLGQEVDVAVGVPGDLVARAADHHDLDVMRHVEERGVGVRLERRALAAAGA
jgi:hypothetical protein